MRYSEIIEDDEDSIQITLAKGDEILTGKFKNRKTKIKGFLKDKNGQPVAKTDKGDQKLLKPRVVKFMPESINYDSLSPKMVKRADWILDTVEMALHGHGMARILGRIKIVFGTTGEGVAAHYNKWNQSITINLEEMVRRGLPEDFMVGTIIHEIGHYLMESKFNILEDFKVWFTSTFGGQKYRVSDYAKTSTQEMFAEMFMHFVMDEPMDPKARTWMSKMVRRFQTA